MRIWTLVRNKQFKIPFQHYKLKEIGFILSHTNNDKLMVCVLLSIKYEKKKGKKTDKSFFFSFWNEPIGAVLTYMNFGVYYYLMHHQHTIVKIHLWLLSNMALKSGFDVMWIANLMCIKFLEIIRNGKKWGKKIIQTFT